jgi:hypothetical protein
MRKALWTALVTALTAASAALAVRLASRLWEAVAKEPPPEVPAWARWLVAKPLHRGVTAGIAAL